MIPFISLPAAAHHFISKEIQAQVLNNIVATGTLFGKEVINLAYAHPVISSTLIGVAIIVATFALAYIACKILNRIFCGKENLTPEQQEKKRKKYHGINDSGVQFYYSKKNESQVPVAHNKPVLKTMNS